MKKGWLVGLIVIIIIIGTYFFINDFISKEPPSKVSPKPVQDKPEPGSQLQEATITLYSEDGGTRWELSADSIQRFTEKSEVLLHQVRAEVYQEQDKQIDLVAEGGNFDPRTGFLVLKGSLTIKSGDKVLKADRLNWNQVKNELVGIGNVLIKEPGMQVTGEKFISQVELNRVTIIDDVRVISNKVGEENEE